MEKVLAKTLILVEMLMVTLVLGNTIRILNIVGSTILTILFQVSSAVFVEEEILIITLLKRIIISHLLCFHMGNNQKYRQEVYSQPQLQVYFYFSPKIYDKHF